MPGYEVPGGGYGLPFGITQGSIPTVPNYNNAVNIKHQLAMQQAAAQRIANGTPQSNFSQDELNRIFSSPAYQQAVKQQILPDPRTPQGLAFPFPCPEKIGDPFKVVISNRDGNPQNNVAIVSTANTTLSEKIGVDFLCQGVLIQAIDNTGPPGNYTLNFGWNFNSSLSGGDWVYRTIGQQAEGSLVPAILTVGRAGVPFRWPAPRIFRSTETINVIIRADPGLALSLDYINITFWGRQLKGLEAADLLKFNPSIYGYSALVLDPLTVTFNAVTAALNGIPGSEVTQSGEIGSAPYDYLISDESCYCFDRGASVNQNFVPGTGMLGEIKIQRSAPREELSLLFVPTSFYGGGTLNEADGRQAESVVNVASSSGSSWRVYQQSALTITGRGVRTNSSLRTTCQIKYVAHGQRMPSQDNLPPYTGQEYSVQPIR